MARTVFALPVLLVVAAAAMLGCSPQLSLGVGDAPAPNDAATPVPAVSPTPTLPDNGCPNGSLEGCFSYNEMADFLETATSMVRSFFVSQYPRLPEPRDIVFVPRGRVGVSSCLDGSGRRGRVDSEAYEYCGANATIYIGQDLLWSFYRSFGDAAPVVGLAHEWAHHIQVTIGVAAPRTSQASVAYENQADCVAGAWAQYAADRGWLEQPDDLQDATQLLQAIGSREGRGRDHGTSTERRTAFDLGYEGGVSACNAYSSRPVG